MKTRLGTRIGLKKPLKREFKMHPNMEVRLESKSTIQHFWSAEWPLFGLWPNFFRVMIRYTLFDLFAEGCVKIRILIVYAYFFRVFQPL